MQESGSNFTRSLLVMFLPLLVSPMLVSPVLGEIPQAGNVSDFQKNPAASVNEVIRDELNAERSDKSRWRYLQIIDKKGRQETRAVCETEDGKIDRLVAIDGHALSPEQTRREEERIKAFLAHPDEIRKEQVKLQKDQDEDMAMLRTFAGAFDYKYKGRNGNVVAFDFSPNPQFHGTGREGRVFHHMVGTVWIDVQQKRLVGVEGRLTSRVDFGGGLLGYLRPGGTFAVHLQRDDGTNHWNLVSLQVHLKGRALFFKTINLEHAERRINYRLMPPDTTLQQGARLLKNEALSLEAASMPGN
jgi:hypothetical protein